MTNFWGSILQAQYHMLGAENEEDFNLFKAQLIELLEIAQFKYLQENDPLFCLKLIELPDNQKILDVGWWM